MESRRLLELGVLFLVFALILFGRLYQVQVHQHEFWTAEALSARTRSRSIPFRRGALADRRGRVLALSDTVYDLYFLFSEFRKRTAIGQLLLCHYLLSGNRAGVADVIENPVPFLAAIRDLTVSEYFAMEPRQRRHDLCVYAAWLTQAESSGEIIDYLNHAGPSELFWPPLREVAAQILESVADEISSLRGIAYELDVSTGELIAEMDQQIAAVDEQVLEMLQRQTAVEAGFEAERRLHREFDYRLKVLLRNVPHAAIYPLHIAPEIFPGLVPVEATRRRYPPENEICPLLIGAVGLPTAEQLAAIRQKNERLSELLLLPEHTREQAAEIERLRYQIREVDLSADEEVGRFGLEQLYEPILRGTRGFQRVETDQKGRVVRRLKVQEPRHGETVTLTLDARWQQVAHEALAGQEFAGAIVLLELPGCKIRIMASHPSPSRQELRRFGFQDSLGRHSRHLRAYRPYFPPPPGSAFKPLVAVMAMSAGAIETTTTFSCDKDRLSPGGHPVRCLGLHGDIDVGRAISKSCNHFFAHLAAKVGYASLYDWAAQFGFGDATNFALQGLPELGSQSLEPPEVEAALNYQERGLRNLMLFGFGQGAIDDVTPLQVAAAVAALATREYRPPMVLEQVGERTLPAAPRHTLPIDEKAWRVVVDAMKQVTQLPDGTAAPGRVPGLDLSMYKLATKTGTPQVDNADDHSWFVGFFPAEQPRYAFAVFLEHTAQHGGDVCAPLFQSVLQHPELVDVERLARKGR